MRNFEVQHTIRLYDTELIAEIGKTYEAHSNEFRNKNEFLTELLRLGVKAMNYVPPTSPAGAAVPPTVCAEVKEAISKILKISEETAQYISAQLKNVSIHFNVIENLLSSIYKMNLGHLTGMPPLPRKVEDGFYDDLPMRFEKLILTLETKFGLK